MQTDFPPASPTRFVEPLCRARQIKKAAREMTPWRPGGNRPWPLDDLDVEVRNVAVGHSGAVRSSEGRAMRQSCASDGERRYAAVGTVGEEAVLAGSDSEAIELGQCDLVRR